jgi:tetratricopeptide (TPR) repeat protein
MRARLRTYPSSAGAAREAAVDAGVAERLAALGYLGGGFFTGAPSGADPKDKIRELEANHRDMREGLRLYRAQDLEGAIRLFSRLAAGSATSFNVEYYLGRSLVDRHRPAEAAPHLEKAAELAPTSAVTWAFLAGAYAQSGRIPKALETVDRGLRVVPDNAKLLAIRGRILLEQGDTAAARATLERARGRDPGEPRVHVDLANLYRGAGDLVHARAEAEEALRVDPKSADAQVAWGLVLGALGREGEAAAAFRAAVRLEPDHADALFYLGSVELRAGRATAAVPLFELLLRKAPHYPGAEASLALARAAPAAAAPRDGVALRLIRVRDRDRAQTAARRAAAGEDFAALARELSEDASGPRGGDLGVVRPADLEEPLGSAAASLTPGAVTPPLATADGYVLLKRDR